MQLLSARYLLDTNIVSEIMRPKPAPELLKWLDRVGTHTLATSSIVLWEIQYGIHQLSDAARHDDLIIRFDQLRTSLFEDRIVGFAQAEADICARFMGEKRLLGASMDAHLPDAMIAAGAITQNLVLVTRNTRDFQDLDLTLFNPWD